MNTITLKRDGAIDDNGITVQNDALRLLGFQIRLEQGYTLRSFFKMLDRYTLLPRLNDFFPTFGAQVKVCPEQGCASAIVDFLEFSKTVEMIGYPDRRLEIYNSLAGVQGTDAVEIKSLQIDKLLDLPLKLGNLKHVVFGDRVDIFEFDTVFTLFEFVDGIAWQLSFHGIPDHCELRR